MILYLKGDSANEDASGFVGSGGSIFRRCQAVSAARVREVFCGNLFGDELVRQKTGDGGR